MKLNLSLYLVLILSFLTVHSALAQNPRDIHINFKIQADAIFNGGAVESNSELSDDNNGKSPNGKPSNFESEAYASKFVNWEIFDVGDNSRDYQVKFLDFPWTGNIDAFSKNPLQGGGKKAKAKIKDDTPDGTLKYTIRFTIRSKRTRETKTFELDPRLKVRRI